MKHDKKDEPVIRLDVTGNLTQEIIEEAALRSAQNMGPAQDMWIPGVGWIMRHGEITQAGYDWLEQEYGNKEDR
jgi:hypothetical protein